MDYAKGSVDRIRFKFNIKHAIQAQCRYDCRERCKSALFQNSTVCGFRHSSCLPKLSFDFTEVGPRFLDHQLNQKLIRVFRVALRVVLLGYSSGIAK